MVFLRYNFFLTLPRSEIQCSGWLTSDTKTYMRYSLRKSTMVNAIYCGLYISQSADEAEYGPKVSWGKDGAVIERVRSYRSEHLAG